MTLFASMIAVTQELASSFDVHQEPQNPTALVAVDIMLEDAKRYHELLPVARTEIIPFVYTTSRTQSAALPEMSNDKTMI